MERLGNLSDNTRAGSFYPPEGVAEHIAPANLPTSTVPGSHWRLDHNTIASKHDAHPIRSNAAVNTQGNSLSTCWYATSERFLRSVGSMFRACYFLRDCYGKSPQCFRVPFGNGNY